MPEKSIHEMSFGDFVAVARRHLDALEACYESGIAGDGHVEEFSELADDAGWALTLARSKGTADLRDIETVSEGDLSPEDVHGIPPELADAITADIEAGLLDPDTLHDPDPVWTPGEQAAAALMAADPGKHEDWDEWLDDWHKEDDK